MESNLRMNWTFIIKKLADPNIQEEQSLIRYILNIATRNLEVEMVLKGSINLRQESMNVWNLRKVLIFPINFTTKMRTQH